MYSIDRGCDGPLAVLPEVLLGLQAADHRPLDLATEGTQRYVWQGAFGTMLIEVRNGAAYVNGGRVTPIRELHAGAADGAAPQAPVAVKDR